MEPGPQFTQLDMFRTAHDLRHNTIAGDSFGASDPGNKNLWADKLQAAHDTGLHESIRRRGIQHPVQVDHGSDGYQEISDGHHRAAVAYDMDPKSLVPVTHTAPEMYKYDSLAHPEWYRP